MSAVTQNLTTAHAEVKAEITRTDAKTGLLLRSVRPNIKGRHGFPLWATLTPEQITDTAASRDLAADIAGLSRLAVAKFTSLRRAVDMTCAGGALLIVAVVFALGGAA